jgi:hypothetical protein
VICYLPACNGPTRRAHTPAQQLNRCSSNVACHLWPGLAAARCRGSGGSMGFRAVRQSRLPPTAGMHRFFFLAGSEQVDADTDRAAVPAFSSHRAQTVASFSLFLIESTHGVLSCCSSSTRPPACNMHAHECMDIWSLPL